MNNRYAYQKAYRLKHTDNRNKERKKYYNQTSFARNHYDRWTLEEIEQVLKHEISDRELSAKLGRSMQSIQHIRCRFKR